MKILLVHPDDELLGEPWSSQKWDRVIDLGLGGFSSYSAVSERFDCPVTPIKHFRERFGEMKRGRELLDIGMGRLLDRFGLDWWELTSILGHQDLERIILLDALVQGLGPLEELYVSRPCFEADVLKLTCGTRAKVFPHRKGERQNRTAHYVSVVKKFPARQLADIFWDKTDPGYEFRGMFNRKRRPFDGPLVLLPSAYVNASRTAIEYAQSLPQTRFLLVVTRRSGWVRQAPSNVGMTWLRGYASVRSASRHAEYKHLIEQWKTLEDELIQIREFNILRQVGGFDGFPDRFSLGLQIRDSWNNVLDREPVEAVICADDSNPYTHIPLLLAKERGLPTISCHHGALDGRYMFKRTHADVLLAKGKMEEDYLVRVCGVPATRVEIGAPVLRQKSPAQPTGPKPFILFFSEPYEVAGGRAWDFYQDLLPGLAALAISEGRELICKLHPAESLSERTRIVHEILSAEQQRVTRVVSGPLQEEMLKNAWFGITVMSTVAVECTLRGVPCFLCSWLEATNYGYVDQFTHFGAGLRLSSPADLNRIVKIVDNVNPSAISCGDCWTPIEEQRLQKLLELGSGRLSVTAVQN